MDEEDTTCTSKCKKKKINGFTATELYFAFLLQKQFALLTNKTRLSFADMILQRTSDSSATSLSPFGGKRYGKIFNIKYIAMFR